MDIQPHRRRVWCGTVLGGLDKFVHLGGLDKFRVYGYFPMKSCKNEMQLKVPTVYNPMNHRRTHVGKISRSRILQDSFGNTLNQIGP